MIFVKLTELTVDARHYHLLRAFQAADGKPATFTDVKRRAEMGAIAHAADEVEAGGLHLDPIFQMALGNGEIRSVQGGYVLTERGDQELSFIVDRLERRFAA